jgi:hypothetical protein
MGRMIRARHRFGNGRATLWRIHAKATPRMVATATTKAAREIVVRKISSVFLRSTTAVSV